MSEKIRIYELDALRFFAALSVVFYHYTYRLVEQSGVQVSLFPELSMVTKFGYLGVNLFFLISGFVILWSAREKKPWAFLNARIVRLYPTFWASMLITLSVLALLDSNAFSFSLIDILKNMTMLSGYMDTEYVDGVYWTLQVELKFYFIVLLLIIARQIKNIEAWLVLWLAVSYGCYFGYAPGVFKSLIIYPFSAYFIAGATFYLMRADGFNLLRGAIIIGCLYLAIGHSVDQSNSYLLLAADKQQVFVSSIIVAIFFAIFLLISLNKSKLPKNNLMMFLGALTYPLYLIHNSAGKLIYEQLEPFTNKYVAVLTVIAIVLFISSMLVVLVERNLKYKFSRLVEQTNKTLFEKNRRAD